MKAKLSVRSVEVRGLDRKRRGRKCEGEFKELRGMSKCSTITKKQPFNILELFVAYI